MYKSKYTDFVAYEEPYTDKFYFKLKNETIAIIHVSCDWKVWGEVIQPLKMPVNAFSLNQIDCEKLILMNLPNWREDVKERSGLTRYDKAMLLYMYRGINSLNSHWFAWSEDDRIEDYHPLYNAEIAEARWGKDREAEDYYTFEMEPWDKEGKEYFNEKVD